MATGGINLSKEFFDVLKAIGESKSKQEEDRIIAKEVTTLKRKLETPPSSTPGGVPGTNSLLSSKKRAKEFLVRLLYVEMLGHDGSFGYIKAVEMAASASLYHKRTGYLVCSACLSPDHEFRFMLVNQMQRDLQSTNILEICGGLLAATCLITEDMVPAVSTEVSKLIHHDSDTIRKKAIVAYHRFYQLAPETVTKKDMIEKLRKVLCDRDPAVMGSSLNVIEAMANQDAQLFKDLVPSLVSILKQIGEHRLPSDFDYHRVPAPWIQMKLVRILAILGRSDAQTSSGMYEILADCMSKSDVGVNAGYAVVYECVKTIATIYPNPKLLDAAGEAISRFIVSRSHNLKYLGVTGLAMIVETNPQYAAQHQLAVMDCLEDPDETLQRKTLDLLYRMTNPVNVEFITERMLEFLTGTTDQFLKNVLTTRICSVAERYAPNNAWYIRTITRLFEVSGDMVPQQVAQNLMSLIAEGTGESDEADMLLRQNAVEIYVNLLQENVATQKFIPRILLETMAWCLGEYGYLSAVCTLDEVLQSLCSIAKSSNQTKLLPTTRKFLLSAIMKLIAQAGTCPPHAAAIIDDFTRSADVDLQQRCLEFQNLLTMAPHILGEILPVDASAEDIDVDQGLSFMNAYVQQSLDNGARPYEAPEDDDDDILFDSTASKQNEPAFKMTPYEKPTKPTHNVGGMMKGMGRDQPSAPGVALPPGAAGTGASVAPTAAGIDSAAPSGGLALNTRNVANVWGKGGLNAAVASAPEPAPSALPQEPTTTTTNGGYGADPYGANSSYNSGGGYGGTPSAPAQEPPKTREQLEKERMAAALFGGIVPGASPPPPTSPAQTPASTAAPAVAPAPAVTTPAPASTPAPAPAAPEVDLLDMSSFDISTPAPAPAPPTNFDMLPPMPGSTTTTAAATASGAAPAGSQSAVVETVSSDEEEVALKGGVAASTGIEPSVPEDPFAAEGLLGDLTDAPLKGAMGGAMGGGISNALSKFEYQGNAMQPLEIATAQFGQQWGSCTATSPISVNSSRVRDLNAFMDVCKKIGAHPVEAIASTNEGICAGVFKASNNAVVAVALLHGKITPGSTTSKIDVTVRSTDPSLSGALAMYLQTMLR